MEKELSRGEESRLKQTLLTYVGYIVSVPLSIFATFATDGLSFEKRGFLRRTWDHYKYFSGLEYHFKE